MTHPTVVVAVGAAGSGKTTFLRRLARQVAAMGETCAVVLARPDPFDAWSFEAARVAVVKGEAGEPLASVCQRAAANARVVLVEIPEGEGVSIDAPVKLITLVNAQQPIERAAASLTAGAGAVLVNKMDTLPEASAWGFIGAVRSRVASALVVPTVEGALTLRELEAVEARAVRVEAVEGLERDWVSVDEELERAAAELLVHDPPVSTRRVKGCVRVRGEAAPWIVQVTDRSGSLRPWVLAARPPEGLVWTRDSTVDGGVSEGEMRYRVRVGMSVNGL